MLYCGHMKIDREYGMQRKGKWVYLYLVCRLSIVLQNIVKLASGCLVIVAHERQIVLNVRDNQLTNKRTTCMIAREMRGSTAPMAAPTSSGTWSIVTYLYSNWKLIVIHKNVRAYDPPHKPHSHNYQVYIEDIQKCNQTKVKDVINRSAIQRNYLFFGITSVCPLLNGLISCNAQKWQERTTKLSLKVGIASLSEVAGSDISMTSKGCSLT